MFYFWYMVIFIWFIYVNNITCFFICIIIFIYLFIKPIITLTSPEAINVSYNDGFSNDILLFNNLLYLIERYCNSIFLKPTF